MKEIININYACSVYIYIYTSAILNKKRLNETRSNWTEHARAKIMNICEILVNILINFRNVKNIVLFKKTRCIMICSNYVKLFRIFFSIILI